MTAYALRVHEGEGAARALEFVQQTGGHLVIRHEKDEDDPRPHWHALFWSSLKVETLRARLVKAAPEIKGNKAYSLKVCDNEEIYERYMCHANGEGDKVQIVSCQGLKYSQEWAQQQNKVWWSTRKEIAKKKATSKPDTVNELLDRCKKQGYYLRKHIVDELIAMFMEQKRPLNLHYAKGVVNIVECLLGGDSARAALAAQIISSY